MISLSNYQEPSSSLYQRLQHSPVLHLYCVPSPQPTSSAIVQLLAFLSASPASHSLQPPPNASGRGEVHRHTAEATSPAQPASHPSSATLPQDCRRPPPGDHATWPASGASPSHAPRLPYPSAARVHL